MTWIEQKTLTRMQGMFGDLEKETLKRMQNGFAPGQVEVEEEPASEADSEAKVVIILG